LQVSANDNKVDFEKLNKRLGEIPNLIAKNDYAKLKQIVEYIDDNLADNPSAYVTTARLFLLISERDANDRILALRERVFRKAINQNVDSLPYCLGQQIDILNSHKRILLANDAEFLLINERKYLCQKMIKNIQKIQSYIDKTFDEENFDFRELIEIPEDEPDLLIGAFNGPYVELNLPSEKIKDKDKREKFERQVAEAKAMIEKADLQREAKRIIKEKYETAKLFLATMYSLPPFATSELEKLLKDNKVDATFAKEILDAVKKAEKDVPHPSDYRNWQSTDKLFKTNAKFISLDNGDVTLEKTDGKRTTIELSVLRDIDQRFIKEQLTLKQEKPK
jgi:hypothetical protein